MSGSVDPATEHVLLALAAMAILVVTAPFLLTATLDVPAASATGPEVEPDGSVADDLRAEGPDGESQLAESAALDDDASGDGTDIDPDDVTIHVDASDTGGYLVPGREVLLTVTHDGDPVEDVPVELGVDAAGTTNESGQVVATVPGENQTTVSAALGGLTVERTLDVAGPIAVEFREPISRPNGTTVQTTVEGHAVPGAAVSTNAGDAVETDADGVAAVDVPQAADVLTVEVVYGEFHVSRELALDLDLSLATPFPAAGSRADVEATYDGEPADVDVYATAGELDDPETFVEDEEPAGTLLDGRGAVRLPPASAVTVVAHDGHQTAAASLQGLLRNLAIGVVLVSSLTVGVVVTTLRVLRWMEVDWAQSDGGSGASVLDLLAGLGTAIGGVAVALGSTLDRLQLPRVGLPALPSIAVPRLPSVTLSSSSLPSFGVPSLTLPSLALPSFSAPSIGLSGLPTGEGTDDDPSTAPAGRGPVDPFDEAADEDDELRLSERELVRAAVRDLGRLAGVRRVERRTPGQIGRRALDRKLPREHVEAIVDAVRRVEYAGAEATREQATRVRQAVRRLRDAVEQGGDDA